MPTSRKRKANETTSSPPENNTPLSPEQKKDRKKKAKEGAQRAKEWALARRKKKEAQKAATSSTSAGTTSTTTSKVKSGVKSKSSSTRKVTKPSIRKKEIVVQREEEEEEEEEEDEQPKTKRAKLSSTTSSSRKQTESRSSSGSSSRKRTTTRRSSTSIPPVKMEQMTDSFMQDIHPEPTTSVVTTPITSTTSTPAASYASRSRSRTRNNSNTTRRNYHSSDDETSQESTSPAKPSPIVQINKPTITSTTTSTTVNTSRGYHSSDSETTNDEEMNIQTQKQANLPVQSPPNQQYSSDTTNTNTQIRRLQKNNTTSYLDVEDVVDTTYIVQENSNKKSQMAYKEPTTIVSTSTNTSNQYRTINQTALPPSSSSQQPLPPSTSMARQPVTHQLTSNTHTINPYQGRYNSQPRTTTSMSVPTTLPTPEKMKQQYQTSLMTTTTTPSLPTFSSTTSTHLPTTSQPYNERMVSNSTASTANTSISNPTSFTSPNIHSYNNSGGSGITLPTPSNMTRLNQIQEKNHVNVDDDDASFQSATEEQTESMIPSFTPKKYENDIDDDDNDISFNDLEDTSMSKMSSLLKSCMYILAFGASILIFYGGLDLMFEPIIVKMATSPIMSFANLDALRSLVPTTTTTTIPEADMVSSPLKGIEVGKEEEEVVVPSLPCFLDTGILNMENLSPESQHSCIGHLNAQPCPKYGRCKGGALLNCHIAETTIDDNDDDDETECMQDNDDNECSATTSTNNSFRFYIPSDTKDECIMSNETYTMFSNLKTTLMDLSVQQCCGSKSSLTKNQIWTNHPGEDRTFLFDVDAVASLLDLEGYLILALMEVVSGGDGGGGGYHTNNDEGSSIVLSPYREGHEESLGWIGLSTSEIDNNLELPFKCWIRSFLLDFITALFMLIWKIALILIIQVWNVVSTYPLPSLITSTVLYIFHFIHSRRKRLSEQREMVTTLRELAYDKLVLVDKGEGCAALHLREDIMHELYPQQCPERKNLMINIWPRVVAEVRLDNRVRKGRKDIGGKSLEWWEWIADASRKSRRSGKFIKA